MAEWLTIEEIAKHLAIDEQTVYRLAYQAKIPASKIANTWRFNKERVDNWFTDEGHKRILLEEAHREKNIFVRRIKKKDKTHGQQ